MRSSMPSSPIDRAGRGRLSTPFYFLLFLIFSTANALHHMRIAPMAQVAQVSPRARTVPLVVSNQCKETIYPGVATQAGKSPGTNGFGLEPGETRNLTVGQDWQGRVWGRTNCSFNDDGTGPSNNQGAACSTGDCFGVVDCKVAVGVITLSEPFVC